MNGSIYVPANHSCTFLDGAAELESTRRFWPGQPRLSVFKCIISDFLVVFYFCCIAARE